MAGVGVEGLVHAAPLQAQDDGGGRLAPHSPSAKHKPHQQGDTEDTSQNGSPSNGPKDVLCLTCASPGASVSVYTRVDNAEPLLTLLGLALRRPLGGITVHSDAVCARCHAHFRLMHRLMARLDRLARRTALGFNKASRWFAKQQQKGAEEECLLVLKDSECSIVGQALAVAAAARKAALRTKGPAERKFECPMCGKKFSAYSHRVEHMVVHTRERAFQCSECGFQTSTKSNLARHRQRHSQEHRCHHCGRTLANKFSLKEHLRSHVGERPHHCNECNKSFMRRNELRIHERSHGKGEGQCHKCPECHKTFVLRSRLTRHMLVHRQEKQYVCYVCKKEFTRKDDLKCHERIHTGEKPYTCQHCGRTFRYNTNFHCHLRTHQRLGLSCTLCNMTFPTQGKYSTHLKSRNHRRRCEAAEEEAMEEAEGLVEEEAITGATNGVPELKCEVCGLILESLDQLAAHTLASHVTAPILPHAADRSIIISGMGMGEEDRVVSFSQLEGVSVMVEVDRDTRSLSMPLPHPSSPSTALLASVEEPPPSSPTLLPFSLDGKEVGEDVGGIILASLTDGEVVVCTREKMEAATQEIATYITACSSDNNNAITTTMPSQQQETVTILNATPVFKLADWVPNE